ncbi:response regulator [Saccharopolyspora sp. NPDC050389]|uniref:response regulator n=1 Tax=Saccharopolyspora sp. NPDC050389 TaxID=3155516 RepID=UPI0033CF2CA7
MKRVLVIEDDHRMRDLLVRQLAALRCVAFAVGAPSSAQQAVDAHRPDVVIVDIGLPEMDGFALADMLRHNGIPMIASTGSADPDLDGRVREAGFSGLLRKPFRLQDLARELRCPLPGN